jgi:hypothetical protein
MSDWRDVADYKPKRCLNHPLPKSRHGSALRREFYEIHRDQRLLSRRLFDRDEQIPVKVTYDYVYDPSLPNGRYETAPGSYMSRFANGGKGYVLLRCEHGWPYLSVTERLRHLRRQGVLKQYWRGATCVGDTLKGALP